MTDQPLPEWTPAQAVGADATDEQLQLQIAWTHLHGDSATDAVMAVAHEYADACVQKVVDEAKANGWAEMLGARAVSRSAGEPVAWRVVGKDWISLWTKPTLNEAQHAADLFNNNDDESWDIASSSICPS